MIPARDALTRLEEGNRRFVTGQTSGGGRRPRDLSGGQAPMAAILGCSDSRVPVEILFDQGPGDLFVVRVAGNIASPTQIGSIEFAASILGTRLIVVLGHQECGAVEATLAQLRAPTPETPRHLQTIVETIRPAIEHLVNDVTEDAPDDVLERAIRSNVTMQTERLREDSPILHKLEIEEGLLIVGARYSLRTGEVEFFQMP